jgi:hypothetical protein
MIGFGCSNGSSIGPASLFAPEPNVQYHITPVNQFFLSFGKFSANSLFDLKKLGPNVLIDFVKLKSNKVTVLHNENGQLIIQ